MLKIQNRACFSMALGDQWLGPKFLVLSIPEEKKIPHEKKTELI